MSGPLSNPFMFTSSASGPSFIDAGIYADDSDGRGHYAVTYYLNKRATVSYWYRNDYANSSYGTQFWGNYHGSQDHVGGWIGADGYVYHFVKYNNGMYHNEKSSSACSADQLTHNKWHHFCCIMGSSTVKVYIDGTEMLSFNASDYTDMFSGYWGLHTTWNSNISTLTGSPSWTAKSPTYIAQFAVVTGASPGTISEFINSDGTPIDFQDIDGSGTDLDTQRANPESSTQANGFWLFGANGTTSSKTHNSASDGSSNSGWNGGDSNYVLSTDTSVFPVTGINEG